MGIMGKRTGVSTTMTTMQACAAHLRHWGKSEIAAKFLKDRFGLSDKQVEKWAPSVAAHVDQGLAFHAQSMNAPPRTRPVTLYYAHLNLAVGAILAYRPDGFERYRRHGLEDLTWKLDELKLDSTVCEVKKGAVPLFHSILSSQPLQAKQRFRLVDLLVPCALVSTELEDFFSIQTHHISVGETIVTESVDKADRLRSQLSFECGPNERSAGFAVPRLKIEEGIPLLRKEYSCDESRYRLTYRSNCTWSPKDQEKATLWHGKQGLKAVNYGGYSDATYGWTLAEDVPLLPFLSASLMLLYALASVSRYRPILSAELERSPLNVAIEVFLAETDVMMMAAFRNLLYREEMVLSSIRGL